MDISKVLSDSIAGLHFVYTSKKRDRLCTVSTSDCCHSFVDGSNRWVHVIVTFDIISHYEKPRSLIGAMRRTLRSSFINNIAFDNKKEDNRIWDYVKMVRLGSTTVSHAGKEAISGTLNFLIKYKRKRKSGIPQTPE